MARRIETISNPLSVGGLGLWEQRIFVNGIFLNLEGKLLKCKKGKVVGVKWEVGSDKFGEG